MRLLTFSLPSRRVSPSRRPAAPRGFALLITIVLVAFLVLLLVGLATFTRVETQVADNSQKLAQARQNAFFALNLAVGQLQKHAGPDQRVTARADIDAANTVNPYWTGVWDATPTNYVDPFHNTERLSHCYDPASTAPLSWLVSGNETNALALTPQTAAIPDPTSADTSSSAPVWLLNRDVSQPAERIKLRKTPITVPAGQVPGVDVAAETGAYAWWIGDEGTKSKLNLVNPYEAANSASAEARLRLVTAPRPGIELLDDDATPPTGAASGSNIENWITLNDPVLPRVVALNQLPFVANTTSGASDGLRDFSRLRFHDITTHGHGVLADTLRGGLRRDLTRGLQDIPAFQSHAEIGDSERIIQVQLPTSGNFTSAPASGPMSVSGTSQTRSWDNEAPDIRWQILRSYYNTRASAGGTLTPQDAPLPGPLLNANYLNDLPSRHAFIPIPVEIQLIWGFDYEGPEAPTPPPVGQQNFYVTMRPVLVLANPYNVTLSAKAYSISLKPNTGSTPTLEFRVPSRGAYRPPNTNLDLPTMFGGRNITLVTSSVSFAPGEVRIFTLPAPVTTPATDGHFNLTPGVRPHRVRLYTQTPVQSNGVDARTSSVLVRPIGFRHPFINFSVGASTPGAPIDPTLVTGRLQVPGNFANLSLDGIPGDYEPPDAPVFIGGTPNSSNTDDLVALVFRSRSSENPLLILQNTTQRGFTEWGQEAENTHPGHQGGTTLRANKTSGHRWALDVNFRAVQPRIAGSSGTVPHWTYRPKDFVDSDIAYVGEQGFWGGGYSSSRGSNYVTFFHVLRDNETVASLGQLRHANLSPDAKHPPIALGHGFSSPFYYAHRPSYAHALNEAMWDRYFLSALPSGLVNQSDLPASPLPSPRLTYHSPDGAPPPVSNFGDVTGYTLAATHLLIDGAFNINSTSVEAWKALLGSIQRQDFRHGTNGGGSATTNNVRPFPRVAEPQGGDNDTWNGFRHLTARQIHDLATAIVTRIRNRARPSRSLAEFINHSLAKHSNGTYTKAADSSDAAAEHSRMSLLQGAIDEVINSDKPSANVNGLPDIHPDLVVVSPTTVDNPRAADGSLRSAGAPGFLTQGDLLNALAPVLSARSDTFRVRAYGESRNPVTGELNGQAWCEAIVQRLPEYVDPADPATATDGAATPPSATNATNQTFGRRFKIVSYRWLSPDEV